LVGFLKAQPGVATLAPASWYRVYDGAFPGAGFNPSPQSNACFSTLRRPDRSVVPFLYAADAIDGALMEAAFHKAPTLSAGAHLGRHEIAAKGFAFPEIRTTTTLQVIDRTSTGLRRGGLARLQIVDTDASAYPATLAPARHLYSACFSAYGLQWTSRRLDLSRAIMLFTDRMP